MTMLQQRKRIRVATSGSQCRCYNGCFPSSDWEMIWTEWEDFDSDATEERLTFWRELNDYAVSQSAKYEYRIGETEWCFQNIKQSTTPKWRSLLTRRNEPLGPLHMFQVTALLSNRDLNSEMKDILNV